MACNQSPGRASSTSVMALLLAALSMSMVLQQASATFHRPEGGKDGIYSAFVDEKGVQQVTFLGPANITAGSWADDDAHHSRPRGGRKLLDTGVHCQWSASMNSGDVASAVTGLANYFGSGTQWISSFGVYYGAAVAFACNYGGTQYTTAGGVWSDQNAISSGCANYVGGWYSHESWKSSFGRTVNGWGFC